VSSSCIALAVEVVTVYTKTMVNVHKRTRGRGGRPRGRAYRETIPVRLTEEAAAAVDAWAARQNEAGISRSEAIRRLVDQALAAEAGGRRRPDAATLRSILDARVALERALMALRRLVREDTKR
jgi:hypothetical protein